MEEEGISIAGACKIIELDRSMYYYESVKDDSEVENKLLEFSSSKLLQNRDFPEYFKRIRKEGLKWNHKRVNRIYKKLGMNKRRKRKRRIPNPEKQFLVQPISKNITWSMDFMEDRLENGRKVRVLNIIDDYNCEALLMQVEFSFPSMRVIELVNQTIEWRGKPENIRTDNGTEYIAHAFTEFCKNSEINHLKIQKGKPSQNGYVERFNGSFRRDVLDAYIFQTRERVQLHTDEWMEDYNKNHPHESLGDKSPMEFLQAVNCGKPITQIPHTGLPQLTALHQ